MDNIEKVRFETVHDPLGQTRSIGWVKFNES
jgi:hypothetical protein